MRSGAMDETMSVARSTAGREKLEMLNERISPENIRRIASTRAAATWCPGGGTAPLRTILYDIFMCAEAEQICSVWREESTEYMGRRYSGIGEAPAVRQLLPKFKRLIDMGVNHTTIGTSLFGFAGCIRDLCRSDLKDMYIVDLVNAHPAFTAQRNPDLVAISDYCAHRDAKISEIMMQ